MRKPLAYSRVLAGILAAFFCAIGSLWLSGHIALYFAILHGLGVDAYSLPFLDLHGVLAMGECHRRGIDPTIANPCDPLNRTLPYGPILLQEPFATTDAALLGLVQALLFLTTIVLVLRPRTRTELGVAVTASLSCGVLYALERGNFDLVEFVLIALGVFLAARSAAGRLGSYILFYIGGTVKFYPFALLLTIARERLTLAIGLAAFGLTVIAGYLIFYRDTLTKLKTALPPFEYNTDVFGAACLPFGLADWLVLPVAAGHAMMALLTAGAGVTAWYMARRLRSTLTQADFDTVNFQLLTAGAIVVAGCFFMGPSITYRSIFLLLLLPGLFDLARKPELRRLTAGGVGVVLFCLWSEFFRQWGEAGLDRLMDWLAPMRGDALWGEAPSIAFFIGRELLWWWLVSLLIAVAGVFLADSPALPDIGRLVGNGFGRSAADR